MEKFGIQNRTLVSFLIVLFLFICSNCFAWSQNDDVSGVSGTERKWVRVGLVLDLGSVEGKIVGSSVSLALSDFYTVNSNYRTRIILSVRNSHGEPILALASGNVLHSSSFLLGIKYLTKLTRLCINVYKISGR